jgi:hypothetical protein
LFTRGISKLADAFSFKKEGTNIPPYCSNVCFPKDVNCAIKFSKTYKLFDKYQHEGTRAHIISNP